MAASNGGTSAPLALFLLPIGASFYQFDVTNFNDLNQGSFYFWKVEEVIAGRTATCSRPIITYRDLGVATISVTLSGSVVDQADQTGKAQTDVSVTTPLVIGSIAATQKLYTVLVGLELTAMNLQLSITRAANAGPVSIVKVRLEGQVERTAYA
jgi:hypothetical protein